MPYPLVDIPSTAEEYPVDKYLICTRARDWLPYSSSQHLNPRPLRRHCFSFERSGIVRTEPFAKSNVDFGSSDTGPTGRSRSNHASHCLAFGRGLAVGVGLVELVEQFGKGLPGLREQVRITLLVLHIGTWEIAFMRERGIRKQQGMARASVGCIGMARVNKRICIALALGSS